MAGFYDAGDNFIETRISEGRYATASEIEREGLRLLEEKEANSQLAGLRNALRKGEESGDAGELDMEAIRREAKNKR